jgi:hypothetical protein
LGGVQILHDIIVFEENAAEFLAYASTVPNIMQISAFLNSKDWLLKCDGLKVLIFKSFLLTLK